MRVSSFVLAMISSSLVALPAAAAQGVCDANPPSSTNACLAALQGSGVLVNDIFRDDQGRTGPELPSMGILFDN